MATASNYLVALPGPISTAPVSGTVQLIWGVYNNPAPSGLQAGNQVPIQMDASGNLLVNVAASGGGSSTPLAVTSMDATTAVVSQTWTTGVAGTSASVSVLGYNSAVMTLNGSGTISSGTAVFEVSDDGGTTWFSISGRNTNTGSAGNNFALSAALTSYVFNIAGYTNFRVRNSVTIGGAGGQVIVRVQASSAVFLSSIQVTQASAGGLLCTADIVGSSGAALDALITAATAPANGLATLAVCQTTAPSLAAGQSAAIQSDYKGNVFVKPYRRSGTVAQSSSIVSSVSPSTILSAQAGVFADLLTVIITTTPVATTAIAFTITLSDGTNTYVFDMDTGVIASGGADPLVLNFGAALPASNAATPWTATCSVSTVTVHITTIAILQKAS